MPKTKTIKAWAVVRKNDNGVIDSNLDLNDYLDKLRKILKKVEFEEIYAPAIFYTKRMAEKYIKRLKFLKCKVKVLPCEIKLLKSK